MPDSLLHCTFCPAAFSLSTLQALIIILDWTNLTGMPKHSLKFTPTHAQCYQYQFQKVVGLQYVRCLATSSYFYARNIQKQYYYQAYNSQGWWSTPACSLTSSYDLICRIRRGWAFLQTIGAIPRAYLAAVIQHHF